MAIGYTKQGWPSKTKVEKTVMESMDTAIKSACDGVDTINSNLSTLFVDDVQTLTVSTIAAGGISTPAIPTVTGYTLVSDMVKIEGTGASNCSVRHNARNNLWIINNGSSATGALTITVYCHRMKGTF